MEDPLSRLHMVDLYFTWTDEAALTMLQILVLRAGMYFGTQACNDTLLKASGKRWRRLRALARDGKATEAMRIEWGPPTIQVFGLEWVECKFATLDGIDFSTLTSIELFLVASNLLSAPSVTQDQATLARTELLKRRFSQRVFTPPHVSHSTMDDSHDLALVALVPPPPRLPLQLRYPEFYATIISLNKPEDIVAVDNPKKRAVENPSEVGRDKSWDGSVARKFDGWGMSNDSWNGSALGGRRGSYREENTAAAASDRNPIASGSGLVRPEPSRSGAIRTSEKAFTTLYIPAVPRGITYEEIMEQLTLPGFDAPIALKFGAHRSEVDAPQATRFVHILFESRMAAKNAISVLKGRHVLGSGALGIKKATSTTTNWDRKLFTLEYLAKEEAERERVIEAQNAARASISSKEREAKEKQAYFDRGDPFISKETMLKFPQAAITGIPSHMYELDACRFIEEQLGSSAPKILGFALGPKYEHTDTRSGYCVLLSHWDLPRLNALIGRQFPNVTTTIGVKKLWTETNRRAWTWARIGRDLRDRIRMVNGVPDWAAFDRSVDEWIAAASQ